MRPIVPERTTLAVMVDETWLVAPTEAVRFLKRPSLAA